MTRSLLEARCPACGYTEEDARRHMDHHLCRGSIPTVPAPSSSYDPSIESVGAYNERFDAANEAGQETFNEGFWLGWMWARYPEWIDDEAAAREEFNRETDGVALGEAWEANRDAFFARLPLASVASSSAPLRGENSSSVDESAVQGTKALNPEGPSPAGFQVHVLKTHPEPFAAVRARVKKLEIRLNDRGYHVGDTLWLEEFDPETQTKSGEVEVRVVTHVLDGGQYGIEPGFVAMSVDDAPLSAHLRTPSREEVARVIDPTAWEEYLLEDGRVDQEVASIFADAYEDSLTKADAILALFPSSAPLCGRGDETVSVDESATQGNPTLASREVGSPLERGDPDIGRIGRGHVCRHGIRWPHPCGDCDAAAWDGRP